MVALRINFIIAPRQGSALGVLLEAGGPLRRTLEGSVVFVYSALEGLMI